MTKYFNLRFVLLLSIFTFFASMTTHAQLSDITVGGDVTNPFRINAATFAAMKRITVKAAEHGGKIHEYSGIALYEILTKAGAVPNNQLKGKSLAKYILVTASDNYQVVIALPETDPAFTDETIILADQEDGKKLTDHSGPYQLIVPKDKKPARSVRMVTSIRVQTAK